MTLVVVVGHAPAGTGNARASQRNEALALRQSLVGDPRAEPCGSRRVCVEPACGYWVVTSMITHISAVIHMAGLISSKRPVQTLTSTKLRKPKAMPRVIE